MLQLEQVALRQGTRLLFEHADFRVVLGEKIGLTGANGCGKSSLFAMLLGELQADDGEVRIAADWVIAHVAQETDGTQRAAIDHVLDGDREFREIEKRLQQAELSHDASELAVCHARFEEIAGYSASSRAARLMDGLGFSQQDLQRPTEDFSGGWRMRLNLAQALMCRSDLLLLDEPTNHLDLDTVIWLEQWLRQYQGALMLISHDRDFLDNVVQSVLHIEQQALQLYKGNYSSFERQRAERLANQQSQYQKQQRAVKHMQQFIDRFKAKATKARQAQSRIRALEKMALIAPAHVDSPFHFEFPQPEALPGLLMRIEDAAAGYGETLVLQNIKLSLLPGQRIGLLGLNGAGKSTLIKLIAGELENRCGEVETSKGLKTGYFAQHQLELLDANASPLLHLQRIDPQASEKQLRSFLGGFDFQGDRVLESVAPFSGGEKARLVLAMIVWQKPNLLLLDEPTNHLDMEMRLALNQAIQLFPGTVILVSHDRHLLRSVCDEFLLVDSGDVDEFKDSLDSYPAWLAARKKNTAEPRHATADKPAVKPDRYQEKQQQAAFRKQVQAELSRIKRLERSMEKLQGEQQNTEAQLGDNALYQDDRKEDLKNLLYAQAEQKKQLQELEEEWLELSEQIEQQREAFFAV